MKSGDKNGEWLNHRDAPIHVAAMIDGVNAALVPLEVSAGHDVSGLDIAVSDRSYGISGTLLGVDGRPTAVGVIVLYPTDARGWTRETCTIRVVRPDTSGAFGMEELVPGDYFVAAARELDRDAWFDAKTLTNLSASSVRVTIGESAAEHLTLRLR